MKNSILKSMLIVSDIQLDSDLVSDYLTDVNKQCYQQAVESLLYLALGTQFNIVFAVEFLSKFTVCSQYHYEQALN